MWCNVMIMYTGAAMVGWLKLNSWFHRLHLASGWGFDFGSCKLNFIHRVSSAPKSWYD